MLVPNQKSFIIWKEENYSKKTVSKAMFHSISERKIP